MRSPRAALGGWLAMLVLPLLAIAMSVLLAVRSQGSTPPKLGRSPCSGVAPSGCATPPTNWCCTHWLPTSLKIETEALLVDPLGSGRIFAGTPYGIWLSDSAGRSWQRDRSMPATAAVLALATAPGSATIFAGSGEGVVYERATGTAGVWRRVSPALGTNPIFSLAFNRQSHVLLAGTVGALYRGELRGSRWRWQLVAHTGESSISAITWLPGNAQRAFAAVFGTAPPVLSTTDGGRSWRADVRGLPVELPSQALLPLPGVQSQVLLSTMGGGVWLRARNGWREVSAGLPERHAMPLTAGSDGTLYAGTMGYGIYLKQGTEDWHRLGRELLGVDSIVLSLAISGGDKPYLLAGTARGVFRYSLSGR